MHPKQWISLSNHWVIKNSPHVRESFCLLNPESGNILLVESGILGLRIPKIQLKEYGIPLTTGIQNPSFHWERLEYSTWNPESTAWNPESKTLFDCRREPGRFVPTDVSYPDDSYPKLRWFVPNAKMIRTQTLDDSYPTAFLIIKHFLSYLYQ